MFQNGREAVRCDRSDGWGLAQLQRTGLPILVLSTEANPVMQARCAKLGLACVHDVRENRAALLAWLHEHRIDRAQVIYVGNDVNDLECLQAVGCGIVVGDAHPQVRAAGSHYPGGRGGHGAIRELVELIEERRKE